jgi:dihydropteroate synthase
MILKTRAKDLNLSRPCLMGVLNVTPDSFSDGGRYMSPEAAIARAEELVEEGADMLDIGGESTRPGASPIPLEEEIQRVVPLVEILAQRLPHIPISIDTTKAEVARLALEEGASLVNDVSALQLDSKMAAVVREHQIPVILMHRQGDPRTMQKNPHYTDVVKDIKRFFQERSAFATAQGLKTHQILLDPGIGFGKTVEHNLQILRGIKSFLELDRPLVIGTSRKTFIGKILAADLTSALSRDTVAPLSPEERLEGTLATHLWAAHQGAHILRVHDVKATRRALTLWETLQSPTNP